MDLIKTEIAAGTPSEKIILGGFSQGGAMTYYTVFSSDLKLGGALIMSGYLPLASKFEERFEKVNLDTPAMACHGTHGTSRFSLVPSLVTRWLPLRYSHPVTHMGLELTLPFQTLLFRSVEVRTHGSTSKSMALRDPSMDTKDLPILRAWMS